MNSLCMAVGAVAGIETSSVVVVVDDVDNDFDVARESVARAVAAALAIEPDSVVEVEAAAKPVAGVAVALVVIVVPEVEAGVGFVVVAGAAEAPGNFVHFEFGSQTCYFDLS